MLPPDTLSRIQDALSAYEGENWCKVRVDDLQALVDVAREADAGWHLAGDAARGLRVECDGDLGHEAEQIRAERDALKVRVDSQAAEIKRLERDLLDYQAEFA